MQTVDYTNALQRYKLNQGVGMQAMQPIQGANAATAIGKILQSYFAAKGMAGAQHGMATAEQDVTDQRNVDMASALGAYRHDTPFQAETFPGEAPIDGLSNFGQGQDQNAMAQALMGAQAPDLQGAGLQMLAQKPEGTDIDNKILAFEQAKARGLLDSTVTFADFIKLGTSSTTNNVTVGNDWKVPAGHKPNPDKGKIDPTTGEADTRDVVPLGGSTTEREFNKPTATQSTASNYAARMVKDEETLRSLVGGGFDPTQISEHMADNFGTWGNFLKSPQGQKYRQAQEDWVRAKLRKESGAVIADEEMEREIKVYFPQPGDGPEVLAQKELQRMIAASGMIKEADIAYDGDEYTVPDDIRYKGSQRFIKIHGEWFEE